MSKIWNDLLASVPGARPIRDKCIVLISNYKSSQDIIINQIKTYSTKQSQKSSMNSFVNDIGVNTENEKSHLLKNIKENNIQMISNEFGFGYGVFVIKGDEDDDQPDELIKLHVYTILDDYEKSDDISYSKSFEYYKNMVDLYIKKAGFELSDIVILPILDFMKAKDIGQWPIFLFRWLFECFSTLYSSSERKTNDSLLVQKFKQKSCEYLHTSSIVDIELNPGECDSPLGFHFTIVVANPQYTKIINDKQCVYLSQFLRMVCLKHGGSLCYLFNHDDDLVIKSIQDSIGSKDIGGNILKQKKQQMQKPNFVNVRGLYVPLGSDNFGQIAIVDETINLKEDLLDGWESFINSSSNDNDEFIVKFRKNFELKISSISSDVGNSSAMYDVDDDDEEDTRKKTDTLLDEYNEKNISLNEFLQSLNAVNNNNILPNNL